MFVRLFRWPSLILAVLCGAWWCGLLPLAALTDIELIDQYSAIGLHWTVRGGAVLLVLLGMRAIRTRRFGRFRIWRPRFFGRVLGRTARCHQCKRKLVEYNGSNCRFCKWIRCPCGACGCSFGKMC